jgi:hypothetical protein
MRRQLGDAKTKEAVGGEAPGGISLLRAVSLQPISNAVDAFLINFPFDGFRFQKNISLSLFTLHVCNTVICLAIDFFRLSQTSPSPSSAPGFSIFQPAPFNGCAIPRDNAERPKKTVRRQEEVQEGQGREK